MYREKRCKIRKYIKIKRACTIYDTRYTILYGQDGGSWRDSVQKRDLGFVTTGLATQMSIRQPRMQFRLADLRFTDYA